jgi:hypothetical protein
MTRGVGSFLRAAVAVVGLASLAACGGNNGTPVPPVPPPNAAGPVEIFPGTVSAPLNGQIHYTAFLPGTPAAKFTWSVSGTGNGSIDANSGIYVAPTSVPNPATATITATATGGQTGIATVNITAAQGVAVSPAGIAVPAGGPQLFAATVAGAPVTPTWEVNGTPGGDSAHGTITANGLYTAPLSPPPGGATTVTAVSGANSGTATVTVVFASTSLNGPYAFSYSGSDSGGPLAVAGRFTGNSTAGTLSGLEDYNSLKLKTPAQAQPISGTFVVYPDGSGSATVMDSATIGGNETWQFSLTPGPQGGASQHVLMLRFDSTATGSGTMDQQNPNQLTLSAIARNYAFGLGGFDPSAKPLQMVGKFRADGFGNIPLNFAVQDINDGGTNNTLSAADTTLNGTYFLDPNFPGTGRGIMTLINTSTQFPGTFNFTFYMVDGTHLKLVENDLNAFLAGDCFSAPNTNGSFLPSILTGNYVFTVGGGTAGGSPFAEGGIFATDGAGNIPGGVLDSNSGGSPALAQRISASSYTVDPNFGRVTLPLSVNSKTLNFAAYTTTSGSLEIIGLDTNSSLSGEGFSQTSTGPVAGTFALNLFGVTSGSKTFAGQNALGEVQVSSSLNTISGSLNLNNAGTVTSGAALETTSTISATDANGRGTASLVTSAGTFGVAYYVVNAGTVLQLGTDGTRVNLGVQILQF